MPVRVAFLLLTYLVAAIPFGLVVTTLYGDEADIRSSGSGNIGATNVARVYGWNMAGPVLALDMGKGFLPVLLATWAFGDSLWFLGLVTLVAFLAHCYPVYLEFRGGKGVATAAGAMLALAPLPTLAAFALWGTLLAGTGRSSVASLGASTSLIGLVLWLDHDVWLIAACIGAGVAFTHIANVRRLVRGEEKAVIRPVRFGRKAATKPIGADELEQGPAGGATASLWKEGIVDPLDEATGVRGPVLGEE
jgi:glycerol-3-phosphate acyltransferase PlsY